MVFGMNKGIFDGTYLKHPTRSGACQSSGATKTLDGKTIVGFIYTFSSLFCSLFRISILYSNTMRTNLPKLLDLLMFCIYSVHFSLEFFIMIFFL